MKNENLKDIVNQIRKYKLAEIFQTQERLKQWLSLLDDEQINNFINLSVDPREIKFPLELLINENLLNCKDYNKRIEAISKLKNGEGCLHLFDRLCSPNFLKSPNFYKDIEEISKADTARYALWIINEDSFINSPYHDEDLKLIVETHDTNKKNQCDFLVSDALVTVAGNADSINSPYHQSDMKLIASVGSDKLQSSCSFPENRLNKLAINKVSLNDPYHLENMQILASNENEFLYKIMTNPDIVNGKNYRKEVEAIVEAKNRLNAKALYYYIVNPKDKYHNYSYADYKYDLGNHVDWPVDAICGKNDSKYLENLNIINQLSSEFVLYYVSLLMNKKFIDSPCQGKDLEILRKISNKDIFMDLYKYIVVDISVTNPYHNSDVELLSKINDNNKRKILLSKALDEYSIKSPNRQYDLEYIIKSNIGEAKCELENAMRYYLFDHVGIDAPEHVEALEGFMRGGIYNKSRSVLGYLDELEEASTTSLQVIENKSNDKEKKKQLSLFKKHIKF